MSADRCHLKDVGLGGGEGGGGSEEPKGEWLLLFFMNHLSQHASFA